MESHPGVGRRASAYARVAQRRWPYTTGVFAPDGSGGGQFRGAFPLCLDQELKQATLPISNLAV